MITITTIIAVDKKNGSLNIGFSGQDNGGCNVVEVGAADKIRDVLKRAREEIFKEHGMGETITILPDSYSVAFKNPGDRDRHIERLK